MVISRIHETISISTKGKGIINKVKVPYLEMKEHDIDSISQDINRMKSILKNTKSLDAVLQFLENNKVNCNTDNVLSTTISSIVKTQDRSASVMNGISNGMNEKSIIRTDFNNTDKFDKWNITTNHKSAGSGDRVNNVMQSICFGMNEKSIIKQVRDHYSTIHPTQKPVRLLERLLALTTKEGDVVLDPFSGSGSTAIACINTNRNFIGYEIDEEYYQLSIERINKEISSKLPELKFGT
jgi:site-specific DNA-methyltransferase (adenine-specific)